MLRSCADMRRIRPCLSSAPAIGGAFLCAFPTSFRRPSNGALS
jgi:hypothetical protein